MSSISEQITIITTIHLVAQFVNVENKLHAMASKRNAVAMLFY